MVKLMVSVSAIMFRNSVSLRFRVRVRPRLRLRNGKGSVKGLVKV